MDDEKYSKRICKIAMRDNELQMYCVAEVHQCARLEEAKKIDARA